MFESSIWSTLKMGAFAGLMFGIGYFTATALSVDKAPIVLKSEDLQKDAEARYEQFKKLKEDVRLTYFKELTSKPRQAAIDDSQATTSNNPPEVKSPQIALKKSSDHLAQALERVLGNETPSTVSDAAAGHLPEGTGSAFALQVGSFPDRAIAEEMTKRLLLKGYDARVVQKDVPDRGVVFRVRIHGFNTRDEAEIAKQKLVQAEKLEAMTIAQ